MICALFAVIFLLRYLVKGTDRDLRKGTIALLCFLGALLSIAMAKWEGLLLRARYDLFIFRIDQLAHIGEPGAAMGKVLLAHTSTVWALNFVYDSISAAVMLILFLYESRPEYRQVVYAILLNLTIAPLIYALIPVSGPLYAFQTFPAVPAVLVPHVLYMSMAPNGIPSVHFATALLVWWYSSKSRAASIAAGIFLILTGVTTLASGEHYVFDLIVALPYAVLVVQIANLLAQKREGPAPAVARAGNDDLEGLQAD